MKHLNLLKSTLLLFALVVGSTSLWAKTVLFHETFGDNANSARVWNDSYSVKSGVWNVYSGITEYTVSNVKQGKNTTGSTLSGLNQSSEGTDAYIVIGPLNVEKYDQLKVTYKWKAASIKGTYFTSLAYKTSAGGDFTTVKTYGNTAGAESAGATSFIDADYTLPAAASVSTLYLKITFNTSNTQAIIDEVELQHTGVPLPSDESSYESYTEMATINSDGSATSDGAYLTTSGKVNSTEMYGQSYGLKFESSSGKVNIALPTGARNITLNLLSSVSGTTVKIDGNATPITASGDAESGFTIPVPIPNSKAGSTVVIGKGDGALVVYKISLTYELLSATKLYLTTTDNMDGWRSFYESTTQNYEVDAKTTIYTVASMTGESNKVELTAAAGNIIPGQTPVILKTTAGNHKIVLTKTETAANLGYNLLAATTGSAIDGYRLGYKSGTGVAFYKYNAAAPASGVVYIDKSNVNTSTDAHEFLAMSFGDVTGINSVQGSELKVNGYFDLQGRRVAQPAKGLYIVNGRKVIVP